MIANEVKGVAVVHATFTCKKQMGLEYDNDMQYEQLIWTFWKMKDKGTG